MFQPDSPKKKEFCLPGGKKRGKEPRRIIDILLKKLELRSAKPLER